MASGPPSKTRIYALRPDPSKPAPRPAGTADTPPAGTPAIGSAPGGQHEPRPLRPGDPVPLFRTDLTIEQGSSPGIFEVTDPASGRRFSLYDFEVSIARMLDGRRHASDVVENGARLGIPVDLDSLYKFVRQLWRYGFLAAPGAGPPAQEKGRKSTWGKRDKWDEAARTLFQTGLRHLRQGRPENARGYFQAVLDADPGNAEAADFLASIARGEHAPTSPAGGEETVAGWGRRRRIVVLAGGLLAIVVAAAVALVLVLGRPRAHAPPPPVAVPTPAPASSPPAQPQWRAARVQRLQHPPLQELTAPVSGRVVFTKATGDRVRKGERIGVIAGSGRARGPAAADHAAEERVKQLEALARRDPVYRDFLEKERRALKRKQRGGAARETPITSPASGVLLLGASSGARVERGQALALVTDEAVWVVEAFMEGEPVPADAPCEVRGEDATERIACKLDSVTQREGGNQLASTVASADAPWLESSRSYSLRVLVAPPPVPAPARGKDEAAR